MTASKTTIRAEPIIAILTLGIIVMTSIAIASVWLHLKEGRGNQVKPVTRVWIDYPDEEAAQYSEEALQFEKREKDKRAHRKRWRTRLKEMKSGEREKRDKMLDLLPEQDVCRAGLERLREQRQLAGADLQVRAFKLNTCVMQYTSSVQRLKDSNRRIEHIDAIINEIDRSLE